MRKRIAGPLLMVCLASAPALAELQDYEIVSGGTASDSVAVKSFGVACPIGTSVLGGGTGIFGSRDNKSVTTSRPLFDFGSGDAIGWQSEAQELYASANSWSLTPFAICGNVSGLERSGDATASDGNASKSLQVMCPNGKSAISGGFEIAGASDGVAAYKSTPILAQGSDKPIGWDAAAFTYVATNNNWSLIVQVLCADLDVLVVRGERGNDNTQDRTMTMYCPAGGAVLGGGASLSGSIVDWIGGSYPDSFLGAWTTSSERASAGGSFTTLETVAICPEPDRALLGVGALGSLFAFARGQRAGARRSDAKGVITSLARLALPDSR